MDLSYQVEQKQVLSQRMIQSASILQMNAVECREYIEKLSLENPVIDLEEHKAEEPEEQRLKEYQWLNSLNANNYTTYSPPDPDEDAVDDDYRFSQKVEETLRDYLHSQLITLHLNPQREKIIDYFLECLDSRGYLMENLHSIAEIFHISKQEAEAVLALLQGLEPAGVFARDLRECLILQAKRSGVLTPLMEKLLLDHLEQIAENRIPELAREMGVTVGEMAACCESIKKLNPKPGAYFADRKLMQYLTPDVLIIKFRNQFDILLNERMYPSIQVNGYYSNMLRTELDSETREYLKSKIGQAEWIRDCMAKRSQTMLAVSHQIVALQQDFFEKGPQYLKPMRLADIAARIEMHESTVSRAVHGKYLQCSWGIYPMNFFFSRKLSSAGGEEVSNKLAKKAIQELIEAEDARKPYSDQQIADLLCQQEIHISRRTVAKYRGELGIQERKLRKKY